MRRPPDSGPPGSRVARPRQEAGHQQTLYLGDAIVAQSADESVEARRARDRAMAEAEARRAADQDRAVIDQAITHLAALGRPFSANQVRELLPVVSPALVGARFLAAARDGLIKAVGVTQASHTAGHGRLLRVWRGTRS